MKPMIKGDAVDEMQPMTLAVAVSLGIVQPLFIKTGFYDIVSAKTAWILVLGLWTVLLISVASFSKKRRRMLCRPGRETLSVILFAAAYALSALNSTYPDVWVGGEGRYNGALFYMALAALYLALQLCGHGLRPVGVFCIETSGLLAAALTVLNFSGFDVLGIFRTLNQVEDRLMTATLGNVNFAAVLYLISLTLSGWQLFAGAESLVPLSRPKKVFLIFVWSISGCALVCCGSNGAFLALAVVLMIGLCLPGCTWSRLKNYAAGAFSIQSLNLLVGTCCTLLKSLHLNRDIGRTATILLLSPKSAVFCLLCLAGAYVLFRQLAKNFEAPLTKPMRLTTAVLSILVLLFAVFSFRPEWGSNRGYIWSLTLPAFSELSGLHKLIGAGPDCVVHLLNPKYTQELIAINGTTVDSMHNEYLQYLLCVGLLGAALWVVVLAVHLHTVLRTSDALSGGVALAVVAYAVQALFNIATPATTPVFFLLLLCCTQNASHPATLPHSKKTLLFVFLFQLFLLPQAWWLTS